MARTAHNRAIAFYGTATAVRSRPSGFQIAARMIATTPAMTASLTSALRLRAFRPAARSAFEMISRASAAAVRSAARRRSWSRRLGPIGRAYLESSSAAKRQCLAFMYQEVCSGSRPRAAQTRVAGARLMATKGNDGRSCVLRTELADGDAAAHSEDLAA